MAHFWVKVSAKISSRPFRGYLAVRAHLVVQQYDSSELSYNIFLPFNMYITDDTLLRVSHRHDFVLHC